MLRRWFGGMRKRREQELDEELRSYFEERGERPASGDMTRVKESVRDVWTGAAIETTLQDAKYGLRILRKNPGFALTAILSLALGLGANTAIFTLIDTILLRSLPVKAPDRLFFIDNSGGKSGGSSGPPYPLFEIMRDSNHYFSGVAAFSGELFRATIDGSQERIRGQYASGNFFDILGVQAAHGRLLTLTDRESAVISYGLWERRFGLRPEVLGKTIPLGTNTVTIVGVSAPGFLGLSAGTPVDLTVPMEVSPNNLRNRANWWFSMVGRLKDGASPEPARAELDSFFQPYIQEVGLKGETRTYFSGIALVPAGKGLAELRRGFSRPLLIVMAIAGLVLLIGCANVANLLLARASARRGEIAMRLAIGASRGRIFRQLLTEGLLIVIAAAAFGLLIAKWGVAALVGLFAGPRGRIVLQPEFDSRVIGFTVALALLACLLFSVAPAWHAVRDRIAVRGSRFRTGNMLVVVQIMLSAVLLCGAAMFIRTLRNLNELDAGFRREGVYLVGVEGTFPRKRASTDSKLNEAEHAKLARMWEELLAPLQSMPQVGAIGVSTLSPLGRRDRGVVMKTGFEQGETGRGIHINQVTHGYFDAFGVQTVAGRVVTATDNADAPKVAVLNEAAVKAKFPDGNPIGRRVSFPGQRVTAEYEIVGIVRDVRYESLRKAAEPMVYIPLQQSIDPVTNVMVAMRVKADPAGLLTLLRKRATEIVPGGFASSAVTMQQVQEDSLLQERLLSILGGLFGGLALLLAVIGLYGILSFTVIRRTREIGIRIAIGAANSTILWLVLRNTLQLIGLGLALGIPAVWLASTYIETQLYGLKAGDPATIAATGLILLSVALAAGAWPAWRASRVDPLVALRHV